MGFPGLSQPLPTAVPVYYCPWPLPYPPQVLYPSPSLPPDASTLPTPLKKYKRTWSKEQVEELYLAANQYCKEHDKEIGSLDLTDFAYISQRLCHSPRKCMHKIMEIQVSGSLRSGVWSPQEDQLLRLLLSQKKKWGHVASAINTEFHKGMKVRTGKQCKERWNNHVNPLIDRGEWTDREDLQLLESYQRLGNKWSTIAKSLPNRTDSSIKNRVKSLLNKAKQCIASSTSPDHLSLLIHHKRTAVSATASASPASMQAGCMSFTSAASLSRCG